MLEKVKNYTKKLVTSHLPLTTLELEGRLLLWLELKTSAFLTKPWRSL
jgi:hypothetical protein